MLCLYRYLVVWGGGGLYEACKKFGGAGFRPPMNLGVESEGEQVAKLDPKTVVMQPTCVLLVSPLPKEPLRLNGGIVFAGDNRPFIVLIFNSLTFTPVAIQLSW